MAKIYGERWETVEQLPEGGQAHTFLVRDLTSTDQAARFVLKRLKNTKRLARFKREVDATLGLEHRNIVHPIDYDLTTKEPYLVTDYFDGGTLTHLMRKRQPDIIESLRLFIAIADAVNHAHSQGVIHRDLKPDNIFIRLPAEEPVVGDFGLCFIVDDDERHTITDEAVGPRLFMAPELEDGRLDDITPASDVYSLGKLLYWLVSHGRMFSREKLREAKWDLNKCLQHAFEQGFNPEGEHLTQLLETMVTASPGDRASLNEVILSAKRVQHIIHQGLNAIRPGLPQTCTYCGWGRYGEVASGTAVYNFGLTPVGNPNWKVFVCSECGHVQMFRLDMSHGTRWS